MNQEQVRAEQNFESSASKDAIFERAPKGNSEQAPQSGIETGKDYLERATESASRMADSSGLIATLPQPVVDDTIDPTAVTPVVGVDMPDVAADDELIEKEWVDRAKKIVEETKSDPYAQEKAVYRMQRDYQQKRGLDRAAGQ